MRAVRFAREHGLLVAVRGGGHNIAGSAICDGGLVIDLSAMRSVRVDPAHRTVRVEPGARLADVDAETQAFGLAVPVGINSTTGIAGLTLGGGFGWLSRKLGMTVDSLLSADVVTADGQLVRASAEENTDLFWGLRGRRRQLRRSSPASSSASIPWARGAVGPRRPSLARRARGAAVLS